MPREYKKIKQYENEIFELKANGKTNREISEELGYSLEQVKGLIKRHNKTQQKISDGKGLKRKGRPSKEGNELPPSIQQLSKMSQLQYEITKKEKLGTCKVPFLLFSISNKYFCRMMRKTKCAEWC